MKLNQALDLIAEDLPPKKRYSKGNLNFGTLTVKQSNAKAEWIITAIDCGIDLSMNWWIGIKIKVGYSEFLVYERDHRIISLATFKHQRLNYPFIERMRIFLLGKDWSERVFLSLKIRSGYTFKRTFSKSAFIWRCRRWIWWNVWLVTWRILDWRNLIERSMMKFDDRDELLFFRNRPRVPTFLRRKGFPSMKFL